MGDPPPPGAGDGTVVPTSRFSAFWSQANPVAASRS